LLAGRSFRTAATPWGEVRVKVKELGGAAVDVAAEQDDCTRLGREAGVDARAVARAAEAAVRKELGLP
jgi:uncharacterized protein (DUF111 family)